MPRYQVIEKSDDGLKFQELLDTETGSSAKILTSHAGALGALSLCCDEAPLEVIDGFRSKEEVENELLKSFKGSNLFPFPNRLAGGKYHFEGEEYQIPINFPHENNAIHGLVLSQNFEVTNISESDSCSVLELQFNSEFGLQGYPFPFSISISYSLENKSRFSCITAISNNSNSPIPVGHGWHPYFKLGDEAIDALNLQFSAASILECDDNNIPAGVENILNRPSQHLPIGDTEFDTCFYLNQLAEKCVTKLWSHKSNYLLKVWQQTGHQKYNYLQLYTPPCRRSIAVEPMSCAPDAFNNQLGLIKLMPNETISLRYGVILSRINGNSYSIPSN